MILLSSWKAALGEVAEKFVFQVAVHAICCTSIKQIKELQVCTKIFCGERMTHRLVYLPSHWE